MKSIRFEIRAGDASKDEQSISVKPDVPLGDIPYYVDLKYDQGADTLYLDFEYPMREKDIQTKIIDSIQFQVGAKTGRIYQIRIDKLKVSHPKIYDVTKGIKNLHPRFESHRSKSNSQIGRKIVEQSWEKTDNLKSLFAETTF